MKKKSTRSCLESFRHPNWDYSLSAAYFVTINTALMAHYFGRIDDGTMRLSPVGEIVGYLWKQIPAQFAFTKLGAYVIMPNHIHGIIQIETEQDSKLQEYLIPSLSKPTPGKGGGATGVHNPMLHQSLARVIRWFKGRTTYEIRKAGFTFVWHSRYYDKIILNAEMYDNVSDYIERNPLDWNGRLTR